MAAPGCRSAPRRTGTGSDVQCTKVRWPLDRRRSHHPLKPMVGARTSPDLTWYGTLESIMSRILTIRLPVLAAAIALPFTSLAAQYGSTWSRVELTPFGSYQWGGSISTDAFSTIPAGTISEQDSFSWGAILSF